MDTADFTYELDKNYYSAFAEFEQDALYGLIYLDFSNGLLEVQVKKEFVDEKMTEMDIYKFKKQGY